MATHTIRAVYTHGLLRPAEPLTLREGEEVTLTILTERERVTAALGDLLVKFPPSPDDDEEIDEEAILRHLHEVTRGLMPPLSEELIEERRNGP